MIVLTVPMFVHHIELHVIHNYVHVHAYGNTRTDPNMNLVIPDTDLAFPAHMAAASGDISHLRMLIEQGVVNINEKDDKGSTPAHRGMSNTLA